VSVEDTVVIFTVICMWVRGRAGELSQCSD